MVHGALNPRFLLLLRVEIQVGWVFFATWVPLPETALVL